MITGTYITVKELENELKKTTTEAFDFHDYFTFIIDECEDEPEKLYIVEKRDIKSALETLNTKRGLNEFELNVKSMLEWVEIIMQTNNITIIINL
jgi:hypothetical protein